MDPLRINTNLAKKSIIKFIREETSRRGFKKLVFGLSGGIDSTLVAVLSAGAIGPENVHAIIMPYKTTNEKDIDDAAAVAGTLNINTELIDITKMVDSHFENIDTRGKHHFKGLRIRLGNMMARQRMSILYDRAKRHGALVSGTSNRTELLLGYFTRYGDGACDINPIGAFYKTQVRQLAKDVGVSDAIIEKIPSAGFWPGQTDEAELGFLYEDVDKLLCFMADKKYSDKKLKKMGFKKNFIEKVRHLMEKNKFKTEPPPMARL